jgi:hypothetical protein
MSDSIVKEGASWTYVVDDTGTVDVLGHASNGGSESIVRWALSRARPKNRPPVVVSTDPPDPSPSTIVGDPVDFSMTAQDPEGAKLSYVFTVNDSIVSGSNQYRYPSPKVGRFDIRCIAWDGDDNGFVSSSWGLAVLAEPDSLHPAPVVIQALDTGTETGELIVQYRAVGNDGMVGLPSHYVVRTSPVAIDSETEWSRASDRPGEPAPAQPGQIQQMRIPDLNPADVVFVAMRAVDDFGNFSPLANTLSAIVKGNDMVLTIRDAVNGDPVRGVQVSMIGRNHVSDINGQVFFSTLPHGSGRISVRDEDNPNDYGAYYDMLTDPFVVVDERAIDLWAVPNVALESTEYESFLFFMKSISNVGGATGHLLRNWNEPVDVYVQPFVSNGLDYEAVIKSALRLWETVVGVDLFTLVDAKPEFGFWVTYSSAITRDRYEVLETTSFQLTLLGLITHRTHYTPEIQQSFHTIAAHEIGHALGLTHSTDALHLMIGGSSASVLQPSTDEIRVIRAMYRMPRGQSMQWYLFD